MIYVPYHKIGNLRSASYGVVEPCVARKAFTLNVRYCSFSCTLARVMVRDNSDLLGKLYLEQNLESQNKFSVFISFENVILHINALVLTSFLR